MFEEYMKSLYMDFEGQRQAEWLFERIIVLSSFIGLAIGYYYQQFSLTIISLGIGFVLSALISIPPWPWYRRHPLKWRKHQPSMLEDYGFTDGDYGQSSQPESSSATAAGQSVSKNTRNSKK